jgi:hypothetical protein
MELRTDKNGFLSLFLYESIVVMEKVKPGEIKESGLIF